MEEGRNKMVITSFSLTLYAYVNSKKQISIHYRFIGCELKKQNQLCLSYGIKSTTQFLKNVQ